MLEKIKHDLIELLFRHGIINFSFNKPITFKSGIKSPIYCDFRKCLAYHDIMRLIEDGFINLLLQQGEKVNVGAIAAVPTGAIAYGTMLADRLQKPFAYVRPGAKAKDHGLGKLIEGADVTGKDVVLIEDLISTAGSLIENANVLLAAGAQSVTAYSIFTYNMKRSVTELADAKLTLHSLLTIDDLQVWFDKILGDDELQSITNWINNPEAWFDQYKTGFRFGYLTKLRQSTVINKSIICFGIDPVVDALPDNYKKNGISSVLNYFHNIFDVLEKRNLKPAAFKLNRGFFSRYDDYSGQKFLGSTELLKIIWNIRGIFPNSQIILDGKFGDIGKSSENYAVEALEQYDADAVTISGYMGSDSVQPFINRCTAEMSKGVYILARTSNPGAKDLQNLKLADGRFVYEAMGDLILGWAKNHPGVGAVVGATSTEELKNLMQKFAGKDIPLLIPGVGGQGGSADDVMRIARETGFEKDLLRINSSSGLAFPWAAKKEAAPADWLDVCVAEFEKLEDATQ